MPQGPGTYTKPGRPKKKKNNGNGAKKRKPGKKMKKANY